MRRIAEAWRNYKTKRANTLLKSSEEYVRLTTENEKLKLSCEARERDISKIIDTYSSKLSGAEAKILERDFHISGLERALSDAGKDREFLSGMLNYLFVEGVEVGLEYLEQINRMKKLSGVYDSTRKLAVRKSEELEKVARELENLRIGKSMELENKFAEENEKSRQESREGISRLVDSYQVLIHDFLSDSNRRAEEYHNAYIGVVRIFEKSIGLDKMAGLFLNSSFVPQYATPGFYDLFGSDFGDLSNAPLLGEVKRNSEIKSKSVGKQSFTRKIEIKGVERELQVEVRYGEGAKGDVVGVFVNYHPKQGFFGRFSISEHQRKKVMARMDKFFDDYQEEGNPVVNPQPDSS